MGNVTDDLDRFLKTEGIRLLMGSGKKGKTSGKTLSEKNGNAADCSGADAFIPAVPEAGMSFRNQRAGAPDHKIH